MVKSIQIFLAIVTHENDFWQMDVKTTFLRACITGASSVELESSTVVGLIGSYASIYGS